MENLREGFLEFRKRLLAELVQAKFNVWFYTRECVKPKTVSKSVAEENLALYQKHEKHLETNLKDLEIYGKENEF